MKPKSQRLALIVLAGFAVLGAVLLAMSAMRENASYFYSPADLAAASLAPGNSFRLGGMVKQGSLRRDADGVTVHFVATDGKAEIPVRYTGILPDLFREGSGMIADGKMGKDGVFLANKDGILAKHDERYMPPQMQGKMHKTGKVE